MKLYGVMACVRMPYFVLLEQNQDVRSDLNDLLVCLLHWSVGALNSTEMGMCECVYVWCAYVYMCVCTVCLQVICMLYQVCVCVHLYLFTGNPVA